MGSVVLGVKLPICLEESKVKFIVGNETDVLVTAYVLKEVGSLGSDIVKAPI